MNKVLQKGLLLIAIIISVLHTEIWSQTYTYTLNGNPINTTGWTMGGNASNNTTEIKLNNNQGSQNGYIYFGTPQNLNSACDYFTVQFSFRITTNTGTPPADGLAFWYIANPPSAFVAGGGLGMPASMNGFALIFDVYNNNSNSGVINANPLMTLRQFTNTGYTEGVMNGLIGTEVTGQNWIMDGNWHTVLLEYNNGIMSVFIDGSTTASITGALPLSNATGYFGFSASTGLYYELHDVKDVIISGGETPDPVTVNNVEYCQFETATQLTALGNLTSPVYRWYDAPVGGNVSFTAPIPNTSISGTQTWYVTQSNTGCPIESPRVPITATIHPKPRLRIEPDTTRFCLGNSVELISSGAPNVDWTPSATLSTANGVSTIATPILNTVYRAIGTSEFGCKDTAFSTVIVYPRDSINIYETIDEGTFYTFIDKKLWDAGTYRRNLINQYGCDSIVILHLNIDYKDKIILWPNAFSPNGDDKNETFGPTINYPNLVTIDRFEVFNRWGQVLYATYGNSAESGWDGTFKGKTADAGVYYYSARITVEGSVREYSGEINLIR